MNKHPFGELKRYATRHDLPTFVKTSEVFDPTKKELPRTAYADRVGLQFPTHTKAATWLSHLWYYSDPKAARFGAAVEANLSKAASDWGISCECDTLVSNIKTAASKGPADSDYALVIDYGNGTMVRRFPVGDAGQVEKAAAELYDNRSTMPLEWRAKAAKVILDRAAEYGVAVDPYVEKAAGLGFTTPQALGGSLKVRAYQVKTAALRERMQKLAAILLESTDSYIHGEPLHKLASLIDECDRAGRIHGQYVQGLRTPEELCYDITMSKAAEARDGMVGLTNGSVIYKEALAGLNSDAFDLLGDDFVKDIDDGSGKVDVEKAATIIRTLPMDDANLILECLGHNKSAGGDDDLVSMPVSPSPTLTPAQLAERAATQRAVSIALRGQEAGADYYDAVQTAAKNKALGAAIPSTVAARIKKPQLLPRQSYSREQLDAQQEARDYAGPNTTYATAAPILTGDGVVGGSGASANTQIAQNIAKGKVQE